MQEMHPVPVATPNVLTLFHSLTASFTVRSSQQVVIVAVFGPEVIAVTWGGVGGGAHTAVLGVDFCLHFSANTISRGSFQVSIRTTSSVFLIVHSRPL